jgi:DNA repair ATPase RecN
MGKPVTQLTELEVQEVSLVDRPANNREFLVVKRTSDAELGAPPTVDGTSEPEPEPASKGLTEDLDRLAGERAAQETHLFSALHPAVKAQLLEWCNPLVVRLSALLMAVNAAADDVEAAETVPFKLLLELSEVTEGLAMVLMNMPVDEAELEMAKSVQAKLSKALAQLEDSPSELETALGSLGDAIESARSPSDIEKALASFVIDESSELLKSLDELGQTTPVDELVTKAARELEELHKAGRRMSAARFAVFSSAVQSLLELAEDISPGYTASLAPLAAAQDQVKAREQELAVQADELAAKAKELAAEKAELDQLRAELKAARATTAKARTLVGQQRKLIKRQQTELRKFQRGSVTPPGNRVEQDPPPPPLKGVEWPTDFNDHVEEDNKF